MMQSPKIIRSKRKTIALVVQPDGELLVRAPQRATRAQIDAMLNKHADWIVKKQAEVCARPVPKMAHKFVSGERFFFLGEEYPLDVVDVQRPKLSLQAKFQLARVAQDEAKSLFEIWYKKEARKLFNERITYFSQKHGFDVKQVKLSSARTRWGSCSSKGYINLTWRLVMAPLPIIDYVVVHELCHLREANHSSAFWVQVAAIMPDYKKRRKWLKENGHLFHWE
jgi:predicted metal-dependent hydrolase